MALYCLSMLAISLLLAEHDNAYEDVAVKFFEHYSMIVAAINERGLWDESDGFYYDQVRRLSDGTAYPVRVRSMTGLLPLCAVASARRERVSALGEFAGQVRTIPRAAPGVRGGVPARDRRRGDGDAGAGRSRPAAARPAAARRRGRVPLAHTGSARCRPPTAVEPFELWQDGHVIASVDYEPAESTTALFGGNSNWRGPIWFPVNYLVISAIDQYARRYGDDLTVDYPHGSGQQRTLAWIANDLRERLVSIFLPGEDGVRPVFAGRETPDATLGGLARSSTSTSTATTAAASAPRTRPAGRGWWPTS